MITRPKERIYIYIYFIKQNIFFMILHSFLCVRGVILKKMFFFSIFCEET